MRVERKRDKANGAKKRKRGNCQSFAQVNAIIVFFFKLNVVVKSEREARVNRARLVEAMQAVADQTDQPIRNCSATGRNTRFVFWRGRAREVTQQLELAWDCARFNVKRLKLKKKQLSRKKTNEKVEVALVWKVAIHFLSVWLRPKSDLKRIERAKANKANRNEKKREDWNWPDESSEASETCKSRIRQSRIRRAGETESERETCSNAFVCESMLNRVSMRSSWTAKAIF